MERHALLAKKKSSKTFFVISKRFRVQRLAAQVPLDMGIFLLIVLIDLSVNNLHGYLYLYSK